MEEQKITHEQSIKEGHDSESTMSNDLQSDNILSRTPAKANESLPNNHTRREAAEFPQKYKTLSEFFDRMTSSLRLLSLWKKSPTFKNISTQVQILTKREFLYKHLAQIIYILPEAVKTDKILIHNEKTLCMEPELKITLLLDIVKGHDENSDYMALRLLFTSRLLNILSANTESCEIPEASLPDPFNKRSIKITANSPEFDIYRVSPPNLIEVDLSKSSHLPASFSRHLSEKPKTEKTLLLASADSHLPTKCDSHIQEDTKTQTESPASCMVSIITNPVDMTNAPCFRSITCEKTPTKFASETGKLMVETPAPLTPQRSLPSCDAKLKTGTILQRSTCSMSTKRTLDFSYSEGKGRLLNFSASEDMQHEEFAHDIIPDRETKDSCVEKKNASLADTLSMVSSSFCITDESITDKSGATSFQQIRSCQPDIVAVINNIFQCANCSLITKEELVHKIIMNTLDIVERREVEEQIDLLEKLVPDWISKKLTPGGDILYNIKKVSDLKSVTERLICI